MDLTHNIPQVPFALLLSGEKDLMNFPSKVPFVVERHIITSRRVIYSTSWETN